MTPGTYLRLRRTAAGLSRDDVALMTDTAPPRCARDRAALLGQIEDDLVPVDGGVAAALRPIFAFDHQALILLMAIAADANIAPPHLCRACGCSWNDPCLDEHGQGCAWSADDAEICTACLVTAAETGFGDPRAGVANGAIGNAAERPGKVVWRSMFAPDAAA